MQETTARVGVGFELPLTFSSASLLASLWKDKKNRFYFESSDTRTEEKFSGQLIDHELGTNSVDKLLCAADERVWRDEVDRLRLNDPLKPCVTVHRDVLSFQEHNLGQRVHPCLVRLQEQTPADIVQCLKESVRHFVSLGVPEETLKMCGVLADWV